MLGGAPAERAAAAAFRDLYVTELRVLRFHVLRRVVIRLVVLARGLLFELARLSGRLALVIIRHVLHIVFDVEGPCA